MEAGVDSQLEKFCATLSGHTGEDALAELYEWARGAGARSLLGDITTARQRWNSLEKELLGKQAVLEERDRSLERQKNAPGADEDTLAQARSVRAALRFIRKQLADTVNGEYWISAMERHGLLPNFTLLDDAVELQLSVSYMKPGTLEFDTHRFDYSRGISSALFELAPGATFYAQGIAATINSVELGAEGSSVEKWRLCPSCSHSRIEVVAEAVPQQAPGACPDCGDPHFADLNQVIDVVQMKKVFAEVEQTRAAINDHRDDRSSARFHQTLSAVVPQGGAGEAWFLAGSGFGVEHLPQVELRWLNLGKGPGEKRMIAARESEAPLFRVCRHCGHVDSEAGSNRWQDHRPWCRLRTAAREETITFALGRTLSTQGVRLFLPQLLTVADTLTVPSVIAAIKLGFKEVLGGDPTHLDVATVRLGSGDHASDALLLHDQVPGGTGYLTQFTRVEDVRRLLARAYTRVRDCACAQDDRRSCPDCLLPYAPRGQEESTSRAAAEAALAKLLADDLHPAEDIDPLAEHWAGRVTVTRPKLSGRSQLEALFLNQFRESLARRDVTLDKRVRGGRSEWTFSFSGQPHTWRMREQVNLGHTTPDFYLDTDDPGIRDIAVYLDGAAFHISQAHERVHGDVVKRNRLYAENILPWSMTWADVERHRAAGTHAVPTPPEWFKEQLQGQLGAALNLESSRMQAMVLDPFSQLLAVLADPDPEQWQKVATATSLHAVVGTPEQKARYRGAVDVARQGDQLHLRLGTSGDGIDAAAWNLFLSLANLFYLDRDNAVVGTDQATPATPAQVDVPQAAADGLPPAWREAVEDFADDALAHGVLATLARAGVDAPDLVGEEIASVMTIAAWQQRRVLLVHPENTGHIDDGSWTVLDAAGDLPDLLATLASPGGDASVVEEHVAALSPDWRELIDDFSDDELAHGALRELARAGVRLPDLAGEEIASVMTIAAWSGEKLAVVYPGDGDAVAGAQWTPVDASLIAGGDIPASFATVTEGN